MDVYRNPIVCGDIPAEFQPERAPSPEKTMWEDFFPGQNKEEDEENVSLQWLSIFVEDCLSATTSFTSPPPLTHTNTNKTSQNPTVTKKSNSSFENLSVPVPVPAKARTKRKKTKGDSNFLNYSKESPLLHQKHWLAESELLIIPKMEKLDKHQGKANNGNGNGGELHPLQPRRCSHCLSHRTPQWRAGPLGPKTLCNACGVRFKSGRLHPEYRPAKSPTFVSYKHSNSHKKVMEMRMAVLSSNSK
ncbi:GATA transcription factor 5-like [Phalaenopsis equestris]|uniref:GATA transcription factor 5-like n=1 Tax=Phalaenopsis equestris TaxID=78828 RepID=UPI0009E639E7|nr:GATA transcription factor 5-like [Phalaenopsis equestris]